MDSFTIFEYQGLKENIEALSIASDIIALLIDSTFRSLFTQNQDKLKIGMEIENEDSSSDSSSEEEIDLNFNSKIPLNEDSDEGNEHPEDKFLTRNEKKPKILHEDESTEDRGKRYGVSLGEIDKDKKTIGIIQSFFENTFVIKPLIREVLDLDNIIFVKNEILGKIDDVFGNVENPFYSIIGEPYILKKFKENAFSVKDQVYVYENKVKIILQSSINEIKKKIGCDASNMFDEEICNENEMEFSDDEMEAKVKHKKKPHNDKRKEQKNQQEIKFTKEKKYYEKHAVNKNKMKYFQAPIRDNFINGDYLNSFQFQNNPSPYQSYYENNNFYYQGFQGGPPNRNYNQNPMNYNNYYSSNYGMNYYDPKSMNKFHNPFH